MKITVLRGSPGPSSSRTTGISLPVLSVLIPIAIVCFATWGYFLRSRASLLRTIRDGSKVRDALDRGTLGHTLDSLSEGVSAMRGGIALMIRVATQNTRNGAAPRAAFAACQAECRNYMGRDLTILAVLTALAPLLGLLGTVMGMIDTFDAVAAIGGDTGARVADGISQALITTQFGLVVAVPGVFGLARLQRLLCEAEVVMAECRAHALQALEYNAPGVRS